MTADEFLPYLPQLRRFARLLTGDQVAGDWLLASVLQTLIGAPGRLRGDVPTRAALYSLLLNAFDRSRTVIVPPPARSTAIQNRLQAIVPSARRVFLLVTVEQFSLVEAADILSMTPQQVAVLLDEAGAEIARQIATRVLILEDEPSMALMLETILEEMGHTVVGRASTGDEARRIFAREKPGLVLADIQLADGSSGIAAAADILAISDTPIIFVTAFPDRLLADGQPQPTSVLKKPFRAEHVKAIVCQTLFLRS